MQLRHSLVALIAPCLGLAFAQSVHVVAASGGGDFLDLPAAVNAAASGDVLLVKSGSYSSIIIQAKSVTIVEDQGATATVSGTLRINSLAAGQRVLVRGLDFALDATQANQRSLFSSNAGWIGIEDCRFTRSVVPNLSTTRLLRIQASGQVFLVRCALDQGVSDSLLPPGPALEMSSSNVHVYGCSVTGAGTQVVAPPQIIGGPAGHLLTGQLFSSGSDWLGGDGASSTFPDCGGLGGTGLTLEPGSTLYRQDSTFVGGYGEFLDFFTSSCFFAPGFNLYQPGASTAVSFPGAARSVVVDGTVRMGQAAPNVFTGLPGEFVVLGISLHPLSFLLPNWFGVASVGSLIFTAVAGPIPPSGQLAVGYPTPVIGGTSVFALYQQAVFVGTQPVLSTPSYNVLLDPSF